jgi:hypothetical protein
MGKNIELVNDAKTENLEEVNSNIFSKVKVLNLNYSHKLILKAFGIF